MKHKFNSLLAPIKKIFIKEISLEVGLRKALGRKLLEQAKAASADWRRVPDIAADLTGASVNEILRRAADVLNVPFIQRVPGVDFEALPASFSAETLKTLAFIPRVVNGAITAFICLDPARARAAFGRDLPFAIAGFDSISDAIERSLEASNKKQAEAEKLRALKEVEAAKQALHMVLSQVKSFSSDKLSIRFSPQKIVFSFSTADGRKAEADINLRVKNALYALLSEYSECDDGYLRLPGIAEYRLQGVKEAVDGDELFHITMLEPEHRQLTFGAPIRPVINRATEPNVLLIDDNQIFAKVLERFLEKLNIKCLHAKNGKEALEKLKAGSFNPDLIICDLHMPEMNGAEFVQRVRVELGLQDLPLIILTSDDNLESELSLLKQGADLFIAKNDDPRVLCVQVEKLLERSLKRRAA